MHLLDVITLVFILYSILRGFFRGLLREAFNLAGIVGGGLGALKFGPEFAPIIQDVLKVSPAFSKAFAFTVIWVLVYLIMFFSGLFFKSLVKLLFLGWADRSGGAIFGFGKSFLIIGLIAVSFLQFPFIPGLKDEVEKTYVLKPIAKHTPEVYNKIIRLFSGIEFEQYEDLIKGKGNTIKNKIVPDIKEKIGRKRDEIKKDL